LADGPTWSSSTAYYSGRRDGERDDAGRGNSAPPTAPQYGGGYVNGGANGGGNGGVNGARQEAPRYEAPRYEPPRYEPPRPDGPRYDAPQPGPAGYPPAYQPGGHDPNYPAAGGNRGPDGATAPGATRASRTQQRQAARQRGLPAWAALLVLLAIAGIGGLIDTISGSSVRGGFNIALVVASLVAIIAVRHRDMFPIVVAPPLVYIVASGVVLYVRSGGLHNRKILIDAAANWLVYGFPAIAGASAAVLIVAGIRLVANK
jgi:hypothetical protein